jgi:hypothetical protein
VDGVGDVGHLLGAGVGLEDALHHDEGDAQGAERDEERDEQHRGVGTAQVEGLVATLGQDVGHRVNLSWSRRPTG